MWRGVFTVLIGLVAVEAVHGQEVRDSAGIRITTNHAPSWVPGEAWTVAERPSVQLGAMDGAPHQVFSNVEAVTLTSDGRIVVADRGSSQVRVYSATGEFLGVFGRQGEGPGEFLWLSWVGECTPGSLSAYDVALDRVTEGVAAGADVETWNLRDGSGTPPNQVGCVRGGLAGMTRTLARPPQSPGTVRWPNRIELFIRGAEPVLIAEVPGEDRYFDGANLGPLALGSSSVMSASDEWVAVGPQSDPEIRLYHADGEDERRIRWSQESIELNRSDVQAYVEGIIARAASDERAAQIRGLYRDYPFPEHLPAYGEILFDEAGNLWVEESKRPGQSGNDWIVFSEEGVLMGPVALPEGFRPLFIAEDKAAGIWRNEYDVEFVWVLNIVKPSS